jgi:tetratricopeptide (TPR) repeat protein
MVRFNGFDMTRVTRAAAALFVAVTMAGITIAEADAQRRPRRDSNEDAEENAAERVFSTEIGTIVLEAQEMQAQDNFAGSVTVLNTALGRSSINPYERSVALQMRGRAYYEQDQVSRAIQDWEGAIATGALFTEEMVNLRINIGQLYITQEQYDQGIRSFERAIADGGEAVLNPRMMRMLAQAYGQAQRYREGLVWAERFWREFPASERQRGDYSLLLFYYQQLDMTPQQLGIITEMVGRWPTEKSNWRSYASLLAHEDIGRETDAFEVNKVMYLNGMLTESREIIALAQYYSFYEYPYRGAVILERELNAGRVERTQRNLQQLSNMWRQAREWERALPVLRQVAQLSGAGEDYLKLGEALLLRRRLSEAETAFQEALNRGGLNRPGQAWTLLGNVRYDLDRRTSAIAAFREGARYPYSRRTANGWITFIESQIRAERDRVRIRERVRRDECRFTVEDLRETAVLVGEIDETGRVVVEVPGRCDDLYNQYGEDISEVAAAAPAATEEGDGEDAG